MTPRRVVLVRGARTSGPSAAGCCTGDVRPFDEGGRHARAAPVDEVSAAYLALRAALPAEVELHVVSPSNWLWLLPVLVRDGRRAGLRGRALRRSVRSGMAVCSLVADGTVLFSGALPAPPAVVEAVLAATSGGPATGRQPVAAG